MVSQGSLLVVDDESANFDTAEILLYQDGYQFNYASNGLAALQYLEQSCPDVILLDVMMPIMDGLEVCRQVKSHPKWQHIPIIMVTALDSKEDMERCLEAGADDFVAKPVNKIELRSRVRSMMRIRQQYLALETSLQLREDLSNMLVHDLRNPLMAIFLCCESLKCTDLQEKQLIKVEQIKFAGKSLQVQIDSLLLLAKLEAGKLSLQLQPVDPVCLCQETIADFSLLATEKRIQLNSSFPECSQSFNLDRNLFRRVLDNLLSNAIKFSPSHSQILLRVENLPDQRCRIEVMDGGRGISPRVRERIFERYEIGEPTEQISQIGLGLAFCKMAIEAHGGIISVAENYPQGTVMTIEI